jgi:Leucine-rich repeat (LRR) protein
VRASATWHPALIYRNDNKLSYLSGIPHTATTLHVGNNRLTSLSSVDHLRNLRFLDISNNQLDSVAREYALEIPAEPQNSPAS